MTESTSPSKPLPNNSNQQSNSPSKPNTDQQTAQPSNPPDTTPDTVTDVTCKVEEVTCSEEVSRDENSTCCAAEEVSRDKNNPCCAAQEVSRDETSTCCAAQSGEGNLELELQTSFHVWYQTDLSREHAEELLVKQPIGKHWQFLWNEIKFAI